MLPKASGFHKVYIEENLQQLFNFFEKLAKANPHILLFKTPKRFLEFFTLEHKCDIYIYNDDKGSFVGIISVIYMLNENAMELLAILIDPIFQRRGYGKKMMLFAEELAKKSGLKRMKLVTNIKNIPAIKFYKNIGYKIVKEEKNYYGDAEIRCMLEKRID